MGHLEELEKLITHLDGGKPALSGSVNTLATLLETYIRHVLARTTSVAECRGSYDAECLLFPVNKDLPAFKRAKDLLNRRKAIEKENYI